MRACERAYVRPFKDFTSFYFWMCFFFHFRFVCIRWYRFLSHLCRSSWHFSRRREVKRVKGSQTNRQNHYTLWNLIFCFLSEWFLWNRNQSLCIHSTHIHIILIFSYEFLLSICFKPVSLCVGTTNRHFLEKKIILSRLNVGCSTNMTRVLEFESIIFFFSQKKLRSICAVICHCQKKMNVLKCSHFLLAAYALKHRKNAFEVYE